MGVFTFVCRSKGGEWTAKQHEGDLEATASSTFELGRKLVSLSGGSPGGVLSSFSLVTPTSGVYQVIIGGGAVGGGFASGGGAAAGGGGGGESAAAAKEEEKKKEESEEEEGDFGFDLFG